MFVDADDPSKDSSNQIKEKIQQLNWLKPLEEKLQNLLEIINHPNDKFGIHHFFQTIAEKTDQLFANAYSSIYGLTQPFPYNLKRLKNNGNNNFRRHIEE